jgi:hypothetical protein
MFTPEWLENILPLRDTIMDGIEQDKTPLRDTIMDGIEWWGELSSQVNVHSRMAGETSYRFWIP